MSSPINKAPEKMVRRGQPCNGTQASTPFRSVLLEVYGSLKQEKSIIINALKNKTTQNQMPWVPAIAHGDGANGHDDLWR